MWPIEASLTVNSINAIKIETKTNNDLSKGQTEKCSQRFTGKIINDVYFLGGVGLRKRN